MSPTSWPRPGASQAAVRALFWLAAFVPTACATEPAPVRLEQRLQEKAPHILAALVKNNAATLQKNHCLSVGVLKFLVKKGNQKPDDNAGPLNLRMAERLEVALVLALKDARIRILHDPSAAVVAQMNRRANHLTVKGRRAFFDSHYPPAWGSEKELPADVLLTGCVQFDDKFHEASITIEAFDRSGTLTQISTFKACIDSRILTEAGVCYAQSRGADVNELEAAEPNVVQKDLPITFEILYDGKPVAINKGIAPEPRRKQKVSFRLQHRGDRDSHTYGVVLKVNGDNTIFPEEKPSEEKNGWKWILKPGSKIEVTGFQITREKMKIFEVDPVQPTDASLIRYAPHAGTFQLLVYRARQPEDKEEDGEGKLIEEAAYIGRGFPPAKVREESLKHLQLLLREKRTNSHASTRGYIKPGKALPGAVEEVAFKPFGKPASLTIRYYNPLKE